MYFHTNLDLHSDITDIENDVFMIDLNYYWKK